jgi:hypothetical protein
MLSEVRSHLEKPLHPVVRLINSFVTLFSKAYSQYVETNSAGSKQELMDRIRKQGDDFVQRVFDNVKLF